MQRSVPVVHMRTLGFPQKLVEEALIAEEAGLFDGDSSQDLVEQALEACYEKNLMPSYRHNRKLLQCAFTIILQLQRR